MNCLLLRHGIAVSPQEWSGTEPDRPLTKEGHAKARKAAEGLRRIAVQPTHILSSPFTRAQETANIVKDVLGIEAEIQLCPELVYDQSPLLLFPVLRKFSQTAIVLCVGHEPHLGQTAAIMIFGKGSLGLSLKKAGACLIAFESNVKPGVGTLEWWAPPAQLRQLGKRE